MKKCFTFHHFMINVSHKQTAESFIKETTSEKLFITEYSQPCQTSKMERFAKIVNGHNQGSEYASILQYSITTIYNFYQHQIFDCLFHCKIYCYRKIFRQKRVNV